MPSCRYAMLNMNNETFALVEVNRSVFTSIARKTAVINAFKIFMQHTPVIITAADGQSGKPLFYGRRDLTDQLRKLNIEKLPWRYVTL
jgi:hypothetical protein